jgi:hypothetical protein
MRRCDGVRLTFHAVLVGATIAWAMWMAPPAWAQDPAKQPHPQATPPPAEEKKETAQEKKAPAPPTEPVTPSPNDVTQQLDEAKRKHAGIIENDPISLLGSGWREFDDKLEESIGLDLGLAYTILYQHATEARGPRDAAGGDLDFFGTWRLLGDEEGDNVGKIGFFTETRHSYTSISQIGRASCRERV